MKQFELVFYPFPCEHIGGCLTTNSDGSYLIVINSSLDEEQQHLSIGHELAHLFLNHLESDLPSSTKEEQAEKYSKFYYNLWKEGTFDGMYKLRKNCS